MYFLYTETRGPLTNLLKTKKHFNLLNVNPNHESIVTNYIIEMILNPEIGMQAFAINKFEIELQLTF